MRAKKTNGPKVDQSAEFYFGHDAKQAFAKAYEWAIHHYADWEDRHSIATNTAFIVATSLQEYINSRPKW